MVKTKKQKLDEFVEAITGNIIKIESLKKQLRQIESTDKCIGCRSLKIDFINKQISKIELLLSDTTSRILRICKKRAKLLTLP